MSMLETNLAHYAAYHRNYRNVATHMIGVPLILLAVVILTSRPLIDVDPFYFTPAFLLSALAGIFYLRLDVGYGLTISAVLIAANFVGINVAGLPTPLWLSLGLGAFIVGWALQFIGHHYEGRKPAFLDDVTGLLIGPLFIIAEIGFKFGFRQEVAKAIHRSHAH